MIIGIMLTFLLLHMAFAFAIGFWLLITAIKQKKWLKILGYTFGWTIISIALILAILTSYAAIKFSQTGIPRNCPMQQMMREHTMMHKNHV